MARAARLVAALTGVRVPAGFTAGIRGKAAARLSPFPDRVRDLLRDAGVLYADETPARTAGKPRYVHVARTEFLTAMHTGDRTKEAIDSGGVLPGYTGTIVRDGYAGYAHLTDAPHAWCGVRGLRDLAGPHRFDPAGQVWARAMADLLTDANAAASAARAAGRALLDDTQLAGFRARYRACSSRSRACSAITTSRAVHEAQSGAAGGRAAITSHHHNRPSVIKATRWDGSGTSAIQDDRRSECLHPSRYVSVAKSNQTVSRQVGRLVINSADSSFADGLRATDCIGVVAGFETPTKGWETDLMASRHLPPGTRELREHHLSSFYFHLNGANPASVNR